MWTGLKSLLNLLQYCFYGLVFCPRGMWESSLLEQGSNSHIPHWKAKSQPLDQQGSPSQLFFKSTFAEPTLIG